MTTEKEMILKKIFLAEVKKEVKKIFEADDKKIKELEKELEKLKQGRLL